MFCCRFSAGVIGVRYMDILLFRYGYMLEDSCKKSFEQLGIQVHEEWSTFDDKGTTSGATVEKVYQNISKARENGIHYLFVFGVNFFPAISEICEKLNVLYLSWSADNPVMEMFTRSIQNKCNRIFLFDRAQYQRFHKYNPEGIFYLPLAADVDAIGAAVETRVKDTPQYDVSMIGSLYVNRSPLHEMTHLTERTRGFLDSLIMAQSKLQGCNILEQALTPEIIANVKDTSIESLDIYHPSSDLVESVDAYVVSQFYLAKDVTAKERCDALRQLSQDHKVHLFTSETDVDMLKDGDKEGLVGETVVHGPVNPYEEAPAIFHNSKINLNMTLRSIETGVPLRVFEVLAAGGFCITNYQTELADLFEIGKDLIVYTNEEELEQLCDYYLAHEEERIAIAQNGCETVKKYHTIHHRILEMIQKIN